MTDDSDLGLLRGSEYPLYLSEKQIAARVGVGLRTWSIAASALEKAGLPKGDPLFCRRRYWPAVKEFLDRRNHFGGQSLLPHGAALENWK